MATADSNLGETCPPSPEQGVPCIDTSAVEAAEELREALTQYGITADVHDGYGLAIVSVWVDLIVWCRGGQFWWRTGWNPRQYRPVYDRHPLVEPERATHRVALRYAELRRIHPLPEPEQRAAYPA